MPIYLEKGKILLDNDKIATHENCCCDGDTKCNAVFTWSELEVECLILFTDGSTTTARGGIKSWLWDFGDGGSSEEQNPVHQYDISEGVQWTVKLYVTDSDDNTCEYQSTVYCSCYTECGCFGVINGITLTIQGMIDMDPSRCSGGVGECLKVNGTYNVPRTGTDGCSGSAIYENAIDCYSSRIVATYSVLSSGTCGTGLVIRVGVLYGGGFSAASHAFEIVPEEGELLVCSEVFGSHTASGPISPSELCDDSHVTISFVAY